MRSGRPLKFGDVIISEVQFTDTFEIKKRAAVVLFQEHGNIVCAVITSNPKMKGIPLLKEEGMLINSVIKINYIFTISETMVKRRLFEISTDKRTKIKESLMRRLV